MIIIKVKAPSIEEIYDFQIDDEALMYEVKNEIIDMICMKNQFLMKGSKDRIQMWDLSTMRLIKMDKSAFENGLKTGSEIMLA